MDIRHFYIEKGNKEAAPLLLLHGNSGSSRYFQKQIDEFAAYYHVYAIDTRGHGRTLRGTAAFTIRQFADDLRNFIDERQIRKAHLLGFSDGGNIALVFALRYPERVDRLILNGANLNTAGVKRLVQIPIEIGYRIVKKLAGKKETARLKAEMFGLMVNEPSVHSDELAAIRAKTLVIAGTNDIIKREHTQLIAARIANADLVWIRGNHFIAARQPKEFNRTVLKFLREDERERWSDL